MLETLSEPNFLFPHSMLETLSEPDFCSPFPFWKGGEGIGRDDFPDIRFPFPILGKGLGVSGEVPAQSRRATIRTNRILRRALNDTKTLGQGVASVEPAAVHLDDAPRASPHAFFLSAAHLLIFSPKIVPTSAL